VLFVVRLSSNASLDAFTTIAICSFFFFFFFFPSGIDRRRGMAACRLVIAPLHHFTRDSFSWCSSTTHPVGFYATPLVSVRSFKVGGADIVHRLLGFWLSKRLSYVTFPLFPCRSSLCCVGSSHVESSLRLFVEMLEVVLHHHRARDEVEIRLTPSPWLFLPPFSLVSRTVSSPVAFCRLPQGGLRLVTNSELFNRRCVFLR